jgi:hypothetical protein
MLWFQKFLNHKSLQGHKVIGMHLKSKKQFSPKLDREYYLASHSRSGNTWLRAIIFYLELGRKPINLAEIDYQVIDDHYKINEYQLLAREDRYIVKTHHPRHHIPRNYVYIARNPS